MQLRDYPSISITEAFNITLISDELRCDPQFSHKFYLNSTYQFQIGYKNFTNAGSLKLTPVFQPFSTIVAEESQETEQLGLPSFISFSANDRLFTVKPENVLDLGTYLIGLKVGYKEYPQHMVNC